MTSVMPEASVVTSAFITQQDTEFYRAFADRVRETVAPEHGRTADSVANRPLSVCTYDGRPATTVRAGLDGAQYGLCEDCAEVTATMLATKTDRQWTITATNGVSISGYLPPWAAGSDPTEDGVEPQRMMGRLDDVGHVKWYPGQLVDVDLNENKGRSVGPGAILCPQINVEPFHEDPSKRIPYAVVELTEGSDDWTADLDPQGLVDLAAKLRAQAAVLDQVAADLTAARADWAKNGQAAK